MYVPRKSKTITTKLTQSISSEVVFLKSLIHSFCWTIQETSLTTLPPKRQNLCCCAAVMRDDSVFPFLLFVSCNSSLKLSKCH